MSEVVFRTEGGRRADHDDEGKILLPQAWRAYSQRHLELEIFYEMSLFADEVC